MLGAYRVDEFFFDDEAVGQIIAMISYLARRLVTMLVTLLLISALVFLIIKLPPGDFLTNQIEELRSQGDAASAAKADMLRAEYGLDRRSGISTRPGSGSGRSRRAFRASCRATGAGPSNISSRSAEVVGGALVLTLIVNIATIIFIHAVAIPIAIYSATHRNTLGAAMPSHSSAISAWRRRASCSRWRCCSTSTDGSAFPSAGMMDPKYADQDWSLAKVGSVAGPSRRARRR